jgi:hypothetical protein
VGRSAGHGVGQGVVVPLTSLWYNPVLAELAAHGIKLHETTEDVRL